MQALLMTYQHYSIFFLLILGILWWEVAKRNVVAWNVDVAVARVVRQQSRAAREWYIVKHVGRPWWQRLYDDLFFHY